MEGEDARGACSCRVSISQIKISSLTTALTTDLGKLTGKLSYRAGAMRRCRLPAWRRASWLGSPSQIRKPLRVLDCVWNVMCTQAENRFRLSAKRKSLFKSAGGRQFSRLLAAEVWASALVMLDTPCSKVVWRVLATHSIRQFPHHFPSRVSPCAITFQLDSIWETPVFSFCARRCLSERLDVFQQ